MSVVALGQSAALFKIERDYFVNAKNNTDNVTLVKRMQELCVISHVLVIGGNDTLRVALL